MQQVPQRGSVRRRREFQRLRIGRAACERYCECRRCEGVDDRLRSRAVERERARRLGALD